MNKQNTLQPVQMPTESPGELPGGPITEPIRIILPESTAYGDELRITPDQYDGYLAVRERDSKRVLALACGSLVVALAVTGGSVWAVNASQERSSGDNSSAGVAADQPVPPRPGISFELPPPAEPVISLPEARSNEYGQETTPTTSQQRATQETTSASRARPTASVETSAPTVTATRKPEPSPVVTTTRTNPTTTRTETTTATATPTPVVISEDPDRIVHND